MKCGAVLRTNPSAPAALAALATVAAVPVLFVFRFVTLVGIPIALFVMPAVVVLHWIFGTASLYAEVGRALTRGALPARAGGHARGRAGVLRRFSRSPGRPLLVAGPFPQLMMGCVVASLFTAAKRQPMGPPPPPRAE